MKIKVFSGMFTDLLEKRVNDFIKGKKIIDIKYQSFMDDKKVVWNSILIIYEDTECEDCEIRY